MDPGRKSGSPTAGTVQVGFHHAGGLRAAMGGFPSGSGRDFPRLCLPDWHPATAAAAVRGRVAVSRCRPAKGPVLFLVAVRCRSVEEAEGGSPEERAEGSLRKARTFIISYILHIQKFKKTKSHVLFIFVYPETKKIKNILYNLYFLILF